MYIQAELWLLLRVSRIETFFQKDNGHTCETILWFEEKEKFLRSENKVMFGFVYIPLNQSKYYDNSLDQLKETLLIFKIQDTGTLRRF